MTEESGQSTASEARRPARPSARKLPSVHERPWAVLVYLAFAALVGLALAAPLAAVASRVTGAYPRGDAELFDPGGVVAIDALRHARQMMPVIGTTWSVVALISVPLGATVLGFCIALLGVPGRARALWAASRALRALPTFALLGVLVLVVDALLVAGVIAGGRSIVRSSWPAPPASDIARWALFPVALVVVSLIGVVHDLARVAAVTGPKNIGGSILTAFRVMRRRPVSAIWSYFWRAILGLGLLTGAAWLGLQIGIDTPRALTLTALTHQVALAAMGWLRLSWLSRATRLVVPLVRVRSGG